MLRHALAAVCLLVGCTSQPANNGDGSGGSGGGGGGGGGGGDDGSDTGSGGSDTGSGSAATSSDLIFAVVGDTRPATEDDTTHYPTAIINKIYQDIQAESPRPQFVIGSGDYQFASTTGTQQQPQLTQYMAARALYSGPFYPAMGNHECTGYTASNCGTGNTDGVTKNMTAFASTMLAPINQTLPYYTQNFSAADNSWTAKVVFVACNAWDSTQSTWLTSQLAVSTTYTFVVRHESSADVSQTSCSASETIIKAHPLTLFIIGHTHTYEHEASDKEIIVGIGGAPLTTGTNYGYVLVKRNPTGTLTVTTYDYQNHSTIDTFTILASGAAG